jgi:hypothetical protein
MWCPPAFSSTATSQTTLAARAMEIDFKKSIAPIEILRPASNAPGRPATHSWGSLGSKDFIRSIPFASHHRKHCFSSSSLFAALLTNNELSPRSPPLVSFLGGYLSGF